jgi:hypothetical protein
MFTLLGSERNMTGLPNTPPGDQKPDDCEDWWDQPITTPMVAATLSILGVQVLGEQEWEDGLCRVLEEMTEEGLLSLQDRRVQIEIRDYDCSLVWAFPLHQQGWIADYFQIKPKTQIMLMISADRVEQRPTALYQRLLRHQLGHIVWALRNSKWCDECYRASREWRKWSK